MSARGSLFRAQLVLDEHRALHDWWRDSFEDDQPPNRKALDPGEMPRLLPGLSVFEIKQGQWRIRLAGTRFYEALGEEISGAVIDDLPLGETGRSWRRALDLARETLRPVCGAQRVCWRGEERPIARFWVRLPLTSDDGRDHMVLGHDVFRPFEESLHTPAIAWAG